MSTAAVQKRDDVAKIPTTRLVPACSNPGIGNVTLKLLLSQTDTLAVVELPKSYSTKQANRVCLSLYTVTIV